MAGQVFQTLDLIRHIYSFGDPVHRQQMRIICEGLRHEDPSKFGKELLTRVPYYYFQRSNKDETSEEILKELVWFFILNRCRCCSRHSHHKPTIIPDPPYGLMFLEGEETSVPEDKFVGDCNCRCRRMMRYGIDHFIHHRKI